MSLRAFYTRERLNFTIVTCAPDPSEIKAIQAEKYAVKKLWLPYMYKFSLLVKIRG